MGDITSADLRKVVILFDHPNKILGTCLMSWNPHYPIFVFDTLKKKGGFQVTFEYFSESNDQPITMLYVAHTQHEWNFVNFNTQTVGIIRPQWSYYFWTVQQEFEKYMMNSYKGILY